MSIYLYSSFSSPSSPSSSVPPPPQFPLLPSLPSSPVPPLPQFPILPSPSYSLVTSSSPVPQPRSLSCNLILPFYSLAFSQSATPTIRQLISITVGQLTLIQSVGTRYPDLGILLLEDDNGVLVDALTSEHQRNAEVITRAILQRWIAGTGRKPTTWGTLVHVLGQCQLTVQAEAIQACFL